MYAIQLDAVSCTSSDDGMMHFSTGVYISNVGVTEIDVSIVEGSTGQQVSDAIRNAIITRASQYGITLPPEKVVTNSYTTG